MSRIVGVLLGCLSIIGACTPPSPAQKLIFDDGGEHLIADETDDRVVRVDNATRVTLRSSVMFGANRDNLDQWEGNRGVIDVLNGSHLVIDGVIASQYLGEFSLLAVFAQDAATIDVLAGGADGVKSVRLENSEINVRGGRVAAGGGIGENIGLELVGVSTARVSGGSVNGGSGDASAYGVVAHDQSVVNLSEGTIAAVADSFHAAAIQLNDEARFSMTGGRLRVGALSDGILTTANLRGNSRGSISGGQVSLSEPEAGSYRLFHLENDAQLVVTGGEFIVDRDELSCPDCSGPTRIFEVDDSSNVFIAGGTYSHPQEGHLDLVLRGRAQVTISGRDFDWPMFEPITETEGTISGILVDGHPFSFTFSRVASSTLLLVPEPNSTSWLIWLLVLPIRVIRRRC